MRSNGFSTRTIVAILLTVMGMTPGCGGGPSAGPTPPLGPTAPTRPRPVITTVTPSLGFTGGGTWVKLTGTGFQADAIVTFGGSRVQGRFDTRDRSGATFYVDGTPAHAAGTVDVIVTNDDGQSGMLTGGYTYASPESFDLNGEWEGGAQTGHVRFAFTVQNNSLSTVTCDTATVTLSPAPLIDTGEISFVSEEGVAVSGRFVSPSDAIGLITFASCMRSDWFATKQ